VIAQCHHSSYPLSGHFGMFRKTGRSRRESHSIFLVTILLLKISFRKSHFSMKTRRTSCTLRSSCNFGLESVVRKYCRQRVIFTHVALPRILISAANSGASSLKGSRVNKGGRLIKEKSLVQINRATSRLSDSHSTYLFPIPTFIESL
jgi:hypothetical protein